MTPTLLIVLTFTAVVLTVAGLYSVVMDLYLRDRERLNQRIDTEFNSRAGAAGTPGRKAPLFKDLSKLAADARLLAEKGGSLRQRFGNMVEQSGLNLTVRRLLLLALGSGLALGAVAGFLSGAWWVGAAVGMLGGTAPVVFVHFKRKQRLEKLLSQLPDAFELIARLIRAGQTTSQAFQGVADEFQAPIAAEFAYCYEQQNLGLPPDVALRDMARRIDLVEMKIFILAVLVQRQTGGNLAELIDNLATVVRERYRIRGKIRVMTAEGRMEAAVLLALPPVVFGLIFFLNRNYAQVLLQHPNVIYGMLGFMLVGVLWIRKIINFDF